MSEGLARSIQLRAQVFADGKSGLSAFMVRHRPRICPFDDLIEKLPSGDAILDFGCGTGFMLLLAADLRGYRHLSGVEVTDALRDAARATLLAHLGAETSCDIGEAGDVRGQFDAVTMIDVMHHIPVHKQKTTIESLASHVKSGGVLLYKDMASRPLIWAAMNRLHDLMLARQWIHYRSIVDIRDWLQACGFDCVFEKRRRMWWYQHELLVFERR